METYRAHTYGPRWEACEICGVTQPPKALSKAAGIGYICLNQEDCRRWRVQLDVERQEGRMRALEKENTNPNIKLEDFIEVMKK